MGFIINLTIALILFTVGAMHPTDERNNYTSCQVKAYFTLYCFLAFYCWMNAMCFNIWSKFASMQRQSLDEGKKFIKYLIYAQGLPLIITLIVLIVDKVGQPGSCASNPFLNDVITNLVEDMGDDGMLSPETNLQNQTVGQSYIDTEKSRQYLPNMGIYGCFLSNGLDGIGKSYFSNP